MRARPVFVAGGVLLGAAAVAAWWTARAVDRRLSEELTRRGTALGVTVREVRFSWLRPLRLEGVTVDRGDGPRVTIDSVGVDWRLGGARDVRAHVRHVSLEGVHLARGPVVVDWPLAELDVLSCPDIPGEVTDGAAQEARAEVEAEHERGLRHGFEVDGAVARALRRRAGLADEPGIEERLQRQRDGRLRDSGTPGDLRPRDGRAEAYRLEDSALVESPEKWRNGAIGHLVSDSNAQPRRCTVDSLGKA